MNHKWIELEKIRLNIIQIYAPAEGTEKSKMEEFDDVLQETTDKIRETNSLLIIMGD